MTKFTYPTKNPEFNIIIEAENQEHADEKYKEIFNPSEKD